MRTPRSPKGVADGRVGKTRLVRRPRRDVVHVRAGRRASGGRTAISRAVRGAPNRQCGIAAATRARDVSRSAVAATRRGLPPGPWRNENLLDVRAAISQELTQHRAVASRFVGAIAANRQARRVRERGDQIEHLACIGRFHFRQEGTLERSPGARVVDASSPTSAAPRSAPDSAAIRHRNRAAACCAFGTPRGGRRTVPRRNPSWGCRGEPRRTIRTGMLRPVTAPERPLACRSRQCRPPSPSSSVGRRAVRAAGLVSTRIMPSTFGRCNTRQMRTGSVNRRRRSPARAKW